MNKIRAVSLLLIIISLHISCSNDEDAETPYVDDDLAGPISRPDEGYGADGDFTVATLSFPSPTYEGKEVTIFYPEGTTPAGTIFYSHPYGGEEVDYNRELYEFIARKGYAVVYAPYKTVDVSIESRYNTLWQSFKTAVEEHKDILNTSKVAFVGHSFGGGASFSMAYKGFVEEGWGEDGRFIFAMAQWYSYEISQEQLISFPENVKLITQIYADDDINDHRMAIDIFKTINIDASEKDFILIRKSVLPTYTYVADHTLPSTREIFDAYDYYGLYRLLDAMIDYSFKGNPDAKQVALGNGSSEQVTMPSFNGQALSPLEVTDNPVPLYEQNKYDNPCESEQNPRIEHCEP